MNKDFYISRHVLIKDDWSDMVRLVYRFARKEGFGACNIEYDNGDRICYSRDRPYIERGISTLTVKKYDLPIIIFNMNGAYGSIYNNNGPVTPKSLISTLYDIDNKALKEVLDEIGIIKDYEDMVYQ